MMTWMVVIGILYTVMMVCVWYNEGQTPFFKTKKKQTVSKFSIIISFKNEAENLPRLIDSLQQLDYPTNAFEIIMVDDHSDDDSYKIVACQEKIKLLKNNGHGKKQALQTGIFHAQYEWLVSIDADCELSRGYLQTLNSFIVENQPVMILGPVRYFDTKRFLEQFQQFEFLCLQAFTMVSAGFGKPFLANGANFVFRKHSFETVGGYEGNMDIASGDDVFLLQKFAREFPGKIYFIKSRSAIVKTQASLTWKALVQQKIRWAGKSKRGGQITAKWVGIMMVFTHISLLYALFNFRLFYWFIVLKFLVDTLCLYRTNTFYRARLFWWYYPLSFIIYPFYLVLIFILALKGRYRWKGKTFRS